MNNFFKKIKELPIISFLFSIIGLIFIAIFKSQSLKNEGIEIEMEKNDNDAKLKKLKNDESKNLKKLKNLKKEEKSIVENIEDIENSNSKSDISEEELDKFFDDRGF